MNPDERLLRGIHRVVVVAAQTQGDAVCLLLVAFHQRLESSRITVEKADDIPMVRNIFGLARAIASRHFGGHCGRR